MTSLSCARVDREVSVRCKVLRWEGVRCEVLHTPNIPVLLLRRLTPGSVPIFAYVPQCRLPRNQAGGDFTRLHVMGSDKRLIHTGSPSKRRGKYEEESTCRMSPDCTSAGASKCWVECAVPLYLQHVHDGVHDPRYWTDFRTNQELNKSISRDL